MNQIVKHIIFLDLSNKSTNDVPRSINDNPEFESGQRVLVQTQHTKELNFYIVLEITEEKQEKYIGKVVGQEGYKGSPKIIYPNEHLKFEFDGLTLNELVWFEKKNAWLTL